MSSLLLDLGKLSCEIGASIIWVTDFVDSSNLEIHNSLTNETFHRIQKTQKLCDNEIQLSKSFNPYIILIVLTNITYHLFKLIEILIEKKCPKRHDIHCTLNHDKDNTGFGKFILLFLWLSMRIPIASYRKGDCGVYSIDNTVVVMSITFFIMVLLYSPLIGCQMICHDDSNTTKDCFGKCCGKVNIIFMGAWSIFFIVLIIFMIVHKTILIMLGLNFDDEFIKSSVSFWILIFIELVYYFIKIRYGKENKIVKTSST